VAVVEYPNAYEKSPLAVVSTPIVKLLVPIVVLAFLPSLILPVNTGSAIVAYPLKSILAAPNLSHALFTYIYSSYKLPLVSSAATK